MSGLPRLLVVMGTTGAGKTKLAVDLCRHLGGRGEVISSDSMQVYRTLDIGTAKVTADEAAGVPHHLIDILDPAEHFTVRDFVARASQLVRDINARGALPILTGGTHYYVQALLWDQLIGEDSDGDGGGDASDSGSADAVIDNRDAAGRGAIVARCLERLPEAERSGFAAAEGEEPAAVAYRILRRVDPAMADKYHPADDRRVFRSLQVFARSGRPHSELIGLQQASATLRYDCCVLWVHADRDVLRGRLDRRVDTMMRDGLVQEVADLRALFAERSLDTSIGALQAIGYKEFNAYFEAPEETSDEGKERILGECVELLKARTRRYARKQLTWIRNRFVTRSGLPVYRLDTSDVAHWDTRVMEPARQVVDAFVAGEPLPDLGCRVKAEARGNEPWQKHPCEVCGVVLNGPNEWKAHLASRAHRRRTRRARQAAEGTGDSSDEA